MPVAVEDDQQAKALAVWWNSTPARLMLLNRRARVLTYPTWQLHHLREIGIPRPQNPAWGSLSGAWEHVHRMELLPMRDAENCLARWIIDETAAEVLDVSEDQVAAWRARLAAEPTITNALANYRLTAFCVPTPEQVARAMHRYRPVKEPSATSTPSRRQPRQQDRTPPP